MHSCILSDPIGRPVTPEEWSLWLSVVCFACSLSAFMGHGLLSLILVGQSRACCQIVSLLKARNRHHTHLALRRLGGCSLLLSLVFRMHYSFNAFLSRGPSVNVTEEDSLFLAIAWRNTKALHDEIQRSRICIDNGLKVRDKA